MANIADLIEEFILKKISQERREATLVQRNELAEELHCAPSQISYVLSTRFTLERGYMVESRRGLGGFVRIVRIPVQQVVFHEAADQISEETAPGSVEEVVGHLLDHGQLSQREAALINGFFALTREQLGPRERARVLQALLRRLADFS